MSMSYLQIALKLNNGYSNDGTIRTSCWRIFIIRTENLYRRRVSGRSFQCWGTRDMFLGRSFQYWVHLTREMFLGGQCVYIKKDRYCVYHYRVLNKAVHFMTDLFWVGSAVEGRGCLSGWLEKMSTYLETRVSGWWVRSRNVTVITSFSRIFTFSRVFFVFTLI
eukprot:TRINITY_DN4463_c0_g3_i2.p1 TRINITY_DN4463_c0_g3~~TRINITY_DN4463_c0_g3_i2.p1  ORF type:complete len:164 (-),score=13.12 TRINITY_DN4463_c0_g3_i2:92-583(-)